MAGSLETAGLGSGDTEQREGLPGKGLRRAGGRGALQTLQEATIKTKNQGSYFHDINSNWQLIINTRTLSSG